MYKIKTITIILLVLFFLCSCGTMETSDGIDTITTISEIAQSSLETNTEQVSETTPFPFDETLTELNGISFSSSLYILFMKDALDSVLNRYNVSSREVLSLDVLLEDGTVISSKEFCESYARLEFNWVCLLVSESIQNGLQISNSTAYQDAVSRANSLFVDNADVYLKLKTDLDDLILTQIYPDLYYDNFVLSYSSGGEKEISEEDLAVLMENNVRKISYTYLPFYNENTNTDYSDTEKSEIIRLSEEYLKRYNKGEPFSDIVQENYLLLDSYNLNSHPDAMSIYYSLDDPMLPSAITESAESLKPYDAALVSTDNFISVVLRLPVNEYKDEQWNVFALKQAYRSSYGEAYAEEMSEAYDSLDLKYNEDVFSMLTLENLIDILYN